MAKSRPSSRPPAAGGAAPRPAPAPNTARTGSHGRLTIAAIAAVLAAATLLAYATSFRGVFVLDDDRAIVQNPDIRALWPITRALSAPPESTLSGRPLTSLTLALNYALAPTDVRDVFAPDTRGTSPGLTDRFLRNVWGYHAVNLLIHLSAALLLFGVVRRTLQSDRMRQTFGRHAVWLAAAVALLWSLHPLQTEAVTYVVQRAESLMGLCCLGALYCGIRAIDGRRAPGWTTAAIAIAIVGMGAKAVMAGTPFLILLWGWIFGPREPERPARRWGAWEAAWAGCCGVVLLIAWAAPLPRPVGFGVKGWTAWTYLLTQTVVITHYLRLAIVPAPLVLLYTWPMTHALSEVLPQAALLTAAAAATVAALARRHPAGFVGAWFFLILAPTSSVIPLTTEVAAEHRMYLPLAALVAGAVVGVYAIGRRALAGRPAGGRLGWIAGGLSVVALASWYGAGTFARNQDYWSEEGIWADAVRKEPQNARALDGYGIALLRAGRFAEAERRLQTAVDLEPANSLSQENLGAAEMEQGKLEQAVPRFERALQIQPDYADAHRNLGVTLVALGRFESARPHLEQSFAAQPDDPSILNALAGALIGSAGATSADRARAVELMLRAVQVTHGQDPESLDHLAAAEAGVGDFAKASAAEAAAAAAAGAHGRAPEASEFERRAATYRAMIRVPSLS